MILIILLLTAVLSGSVYGIQEVGSGDETGDDLCRLSEGVFPNPSNCKSFIRCSNGQSDNEFCSEGLLFNPLKLTCDFSLTGNCSENDFKASGAGVETNDFDCPEDGPNIYPIQNSCTEYYMCDENNVAFKMKCPDDLRMSTKKMTCDFLENTDCDASNSDASTVGVKAIYEDDKEETEADNKMAVSSVDGNSVTLSTIKQEQTTEVDTKSTVGGNFQSTSNFNFYTTLTSNENLTTDSSTSTKFQENSTIYSIAENVVTENPVQMESISAEANVDSFTDKENLNSISNTAETATPGDIKTASDVVENLISSSTFHNSVSSVNLKNSSVKDETTASSSGKDIDDIGSGLDYDTDSESEDFTFDESQQFTIENFSPHPFDKTTLTSHAPAVTEDNLSITASITDETMTSSLRSVAFENITSNSELSTNKSDEISNKSDLPSEKTISDVSSPATNEFTSKMDSEYRVDNSTFETTVSDSTLSNRNTDFTDLNSQKSNFEDESQFKMTTKSSTTIRETDSKQTPGKALSTTQALRYSDPLTDNETSEFTTSTYSFTSEHLLEHSVDTTTNTIREHETTYSKIISKSEINLGNETGKYETPSVNIDDSTSESSFSDKTSDIGFNVSEINKLNLGSTSTEVTSANISSQPEQTKEDKSLVSDVTNADKSDINVNTNISTSSLINSPPTIEPVSVSTEDLESVINNSKVSDSDGLQSLNSSDFSTVTSLHNKGEITDSNTANEELTDAEKLNGLESTSQSIGDTTKETMLPIEIKDSTLSPTSVTDIISTLETSLSTDHDKVSIVTQSSELIVDLNERTAPISEGTPVENISTVNDSVSTKSSIETNNTTTVESFNFLSNESISEENLSLTVSTSKSDDFTINRETSSKDAEDYETTSGATDKENFIGSEEVGKPPDAGNMEFESLDPNILQTTSAGNQTEIGNMLKFSEDQANFSESTTTDESFEEKSSNSTNSFQTLDLLRSTEMSENIPTSSQSAINSTKSAFVTTGSTSDQKTTLPEDEIKTESDAVHSSNSVVSENILETTTLELQRDDKNEVFDIVNSTDRISFISTMKLEDVPEKSTNAYEETSDFANSSIVTIMSTQKSTDKSKDLVSSDMGNITAVNTHIYITDSDVTNSPSSLVTNYQNSDETVSTEMNSFNESSGPSISSTTISSDSKDSFSSSLNFLISSDQSDSSLSSLETTSKETTTNAINSIYSTLSTTYHLNDTVSNIRNITDISENIYMNVTNEVSTVTTTDAYFLNENRTMSFSKYIDNKSTGEDEVDNITEPSSTKLNSDDKDTSATAQVTSLKLEETTLDTETNSKISSVYKSSTNWFSTPMTPSGFTSSTESESLEDFKSTGSATTNLDTSNNEDNTKPTVYNNTLTPEAVSLTELVSSPETLATSADSLDQTASLSNFEVTSEIAKTSSNEIETSHDIIDGNNTFTSKFPIHTKESSFSAINTTEIFKFSVSEFNSSTSDFEGDSPTAITRSTNLSPNTDIGSTTSGISEESTKQFTHSTPLTDSSITTAYQSNDYFMIITTSNNSETDNIIDDVTETTKWQSINSTSITSLPENTKEANETTISDVSATGITVVQTSETPLMDTSATDFEKKLTTETAVLVNYTTVESNDEVHSNATISSRKFEEETDESTKYQSTTYFPSALETESTHSFSNTGAEINNPKHTTITDIISIGSTTQNPVCTTLNENFPYQGDCNKFYQCRKGVLMVSSCVGNEHFSPIKKMCADPCVAKCDPNADCGTTESRISIEESTLTSVVTETEENISSSDYTSVDRPSNKTELSTFEVTSGTTVFTSHSSTLLPTSEERLTTPEISHSTPNMDVTSGTNVDDETDLTSPEINTNAFPTPLTSSKVPFTYTEYTSEIYEDASKTRSEIMEKSTSTLSSTTEADYEATTDVTPDIDSDSSGDDDISSKTSLVESTTCENEGCLPSKPVTPATIVPLKLLCHRQDFLSVSECNEYLDCTGEVPEKRKCPIGLDFNPTTRACDWPYKAECGTPVKPLFEPTDSFECPCKACLMPSVTSCANYYLCLGFTAYEMKCSNSLYFDRSINTCNFAPLVDCTHLVSTSTTEMEPTRRSTVISTTAISTSTTKSPKITPRPFVCPSREGLFKYSGNCGMFYQCGNFYPYKMHCPSTLHFSEITKQCDYPCDAKCDLTLNCGSPLTSPQSDPRCSCLNCKLPSSESCTEYVVCVEGKAKVHKCPPGQTFDSKKSICNWAHRVDCRHSSICPEKNGLFPYKLDCHKFVQCSNGIHHIRDCPYKLEFDPDKKRCEWPEGRCNHIPFFKEKSPLKHEQKGWMCPKPFGYFPNEEHCNKFYHCSHGTPFLKECPEELFYNHRYQTCDWKKHVRCNSKSHQRPRSCRVFDLKVACSEDRRSKPHALCSMYYDCSAGRACAKQCPAGLYFNNMTGVCDLPKNVKCVNSEDDSVEELNAKCDSGENVRKVNSRNPSCFYHCRRGKIIEGCCPKGHIFSVHRDKCERRRRTYRILGREIN